MATVDFTHTLLIEQTPQKVFQAINNVRDWWSGFYSEEIKGSMENPVMSLALARQTALIIAS